MKHSRKKYNTSKANFSASALLLAKTSVLSCIITAILVLILALTMRWNWITLEQVQPINTVIKALSACFAGWAIGLKRMEKGWVLAGVTGMVYMCLAFAVFGILNGSFIVRIKQISDVLMAFACASCTCIVVNILTESRAQGSKATVRNGASAAKQAPTSTTRGS